MAGAFCRDVRTHAPLTSPLEDLHAHLAHLKTRWPTAAHHLHEYTSKPTQISSDYSLGRHLVARGDDDLIIMNIYCTHDPAPSYGVGGSPLYPLYLFYPVPHPVDAAHKAIITDIQSPYAPPITPSKTTDKLASMFSANHKSPQNAPCLGPFGLQWAIERRGVAVERNRDLGIGLEIPLKLDISTPHPTPREKVVMNKLCLRWKEEYVVVRLEACLEATKLEIRMHIKHEKKKERSAFSGLFDCAVPDLDLDGYIPQKYIAQKLIQKPPGEKCTPKNELPQKDVFKDVLAGRIYPGPHIVPVNTVQNGGKPLASLFSTTVKSSDPTAKETDNLSITIEEVEAHPGIDLFFSSAKASGDGGKYWFIFENSCWSLVLHEVIGDHLWGRRGVQSSKVSNPKAEQLIGEEFGKSAFREALGRGPRGTARLEKVETYVASLYGVFHKDPLVHFDMVTGQMWIDQGVKIELVDIVVTVMCAAMNLEQGVKAVVEGSAGKKKDGWAKEMHETMDKFDTRCM